MATAVVISFGVARGIGSVDNLSVGAVRTLETFAALPATSATAALDGEAAFVCNTGAAAILCAIGSAPDAATATATATSGAGFAIAAQERVLLSVRNGDKINCKVTP
jgi:hypothetical protein